MRRAQGRSGVAPCAAYRVHRKPGLENNPCSPLPIGPPRSEIAIYRDFLLHYPERPGEMIGMQATTMAFVEAMAFGDEPNPPNLNLEKPAYAGRKLPPSFIRRCRAKEVPAVRLCIN